MGRITRRSRDWKAPLGSSTTTSKDFIVPSSLLISQTVLVFPARFSVKNHPIEILVDWSRDNKTIPHHYRQGIKNSLIDIPSAFVKIWWNSSWALDFPVFREKVRKRVKSPNRQNRKKRQDGRLCFIFL